MCKYTRETESPIKAFSQFCCSSPYGVLILTFTQEHLVTAMVLHSGPPSVEKRHNVIMFQMLIINTS